MAQFVRGGKSLYRKWALRRHDHPLIRIVDVGPKQILQWPKHHGDVPLDKHAEHVDSALALRGTLFGVMFLVKPIRLVDGVRDFLAMRHNLSLLFLLLPCTQKIREPAELF